MRSLKRILARTWTLLIHGGTGRLRTYETALFQHLLATLPSVDAAALRAQMESLDHLKRAHNDRMVTFYFFGRERLPKLGNKGLECRLATYKLRNDTQDTTVAVVTHRGMLSSFEFTRSPSALEGTEIVIEQASTPPVSLPQAVDRLEHGKQA